MLKVKQATNFGPLYTLLVGMACHEWSMFVFGLLGGVVFWFCPLFLLFNHYCGPRPPTRIDVV